jgi:hypothetical protein
LPDDGIMRIPISARRRSRQSRGRDYELQVVAL